MLLAVTISDMLAEVSHDIAVWLNGGIYWVVGQLYQLFTAVATAKLFGNVSIDDLTNRITMILGVVMLFVLAFSLLKNLVNPDSLSNGKDDKSTLGIVKNLLISLAILIIVDQVFTAANEVQNVILSDGVISNIILGDETNEFISGDLNDQQVWQQLGNKVAATVFFSFYYPKPDVAAAENGTGSVQLTFKEGGWLFGKKMTMSYDELKEKVESNSNNNPFFVLRSMDIDSIKKIEFSWLLALIIGGFMIYILASYTIELGVRLAKLFFYRLIAPIPIMMRIIPSQKSMFDKWLKNTLSTYLDVFLRLAIMFFSVYLMSKVTDNFSFAGLWDTEPSFPIKTLAIVVIILGILMFMKQAPKLIKDLIGDLGGGGGDFGLGIKKRLSKENFPDAVNRTIGKPFAYAGKQLNKLKDTAKGAVTGGSGAALTALKNRNKGIPVREAIRRGALAGAADGGSQFKKQSDEEFQRVYGRDKEQGAFGGLSYKQKLKDKKKGYMNQLKQNYEDSPEFANFRTGQLNNFDDANNVNNRINSFGQDSDIIKAIQNLATRGINSSSENYRSELAKELAKIQPGNAKKQRKFNTYLSDLDLQVAHTRNNAAQNELSTAEQAANAAARDAAPIIDENGINTGNSYIQERVRAINAFAAKSNLDLENLRAERETIQNEFGTAQAKFSRKKDEVKNQNISDDAKAIILANLEQNWAQTVSKFQNDLAKINENITAKETSITDGSARNAALNEFEAEYDQRLSTLAANVTTASQAAGQTQSEVNVIVEAAVRDTASGRTSTQTDGTFEGNEKYRYAHGNEFKETDEQKMAKAFAKEMNKLNDKK